MFAKPTKSRARLPSFAKPIEFRSCGSFVVLVVLTRNHFEVIRKSLYQFSERDSNPNPPTEDILELDVMNSHYRRISAIVIDESCVP